MSLSLQMKATHWTPSIHEAMNIVQAKIFTVVMLVSVKGVLRSHYVSFLWHCKWAFRHITHKSLDNIGLMVTVMVHSFVLLYGWIVVQGQISARLWGDPYIIFSRSFGVSKSGDMFKGPHIHLYHLHCWDPVNTFTKHIHVLQMY